jgi:hypothetical protein
VGPFCSIGAGSFYVVESRGLAKPKLDTNGDPGTIMVGGARETVMVPVSAHPRLSTLRSPEYGFVLASVKVSRWRSVATGRGLSLTAREELLTAENKRWNNN